MVSAHSASSPRALLSQERILATAVEMIEQAGLEKLSMRRLGARLGVEAMALYRYFPTRDALLDAVVERVVEELYQDPEVQLEPDDGWQDYLRRLAHGVRRIALRHPQVFPLIATRPPAAPWIKPPLRSLRWVEAFLQALLSRDFTDEAAVYAYRAFSSFLLGHLLLEVSGKGVKITPVDEPDPDQPGSAGLVRLDARHPQLLRLAPRLAADYTALEFTDALDNLLQRLDTRQALTHHDLTRQDLAARDQAVEDQA